jgi:hypothetical protein
MHHIYIRRNKEKSQNNRNYNSRYRERKQNLCEASRTGVRDYSEGEGDIIQ